MTSRRRFIRSCAAGVLAAGGSRLLASCAERRPLLPGLESELNIYNWSDYIGVETIANFEFETGVRVTYDTYESNEELAAKLLAGASGYDLCVPSGYILPVLREAGLLQPLDTAALEGWSNLGETFTERVEAEGKTWGMPWQWGMTGIAPSSATRTPQSTAFAMLASTPARVGAE